MVPETICSERSSTIPDSHEMEDTHNRNYSLQSIPALNLHGSLKISQQNMMTPSTYAVPNEQPMPHAPLGYGGYAHQLTPSLMYGNSWQNHQFNYGMSPPMPSPSMSSNTSFSPYNGIQSPGQNPVPFPDSPQLLDASQMLMSPSRFRKRRQLSPLISGYTDPICSPTQSQANPIPSVQFLRRVSTHKIPVSPTPAYTSPKSKPNNLILPCFFDQQNNLRVHGPQVLDKGSAGGYWEASRRTVQSFLEEAAAIDEENITIIEIKQLLRRYSINATGKKTVLMDRIRRLQVHLKADLERQQQVLVHQAAHTLASNSSKVSNLPNAVNSALSTSS